METKDYIDYILEARKRGFRDDVIRKSLMDKGWPETEIAKAFLRIDGETILTKEVEEKPEKKKTEVKEVKKEIKRSPEENEAAIKKQIEEHKEINKEIQEQQLDDEINLRESSSIMIFLDEDLRSALEKRAKKNMLTLTEQIEDILRRSTLSQKLKRTLPEEKLDDKLVGLFSRRNTGPKSKKKKKADSKKKARKEKRKVRKAKRK